MDYGQYEVKEDEFSELNIHVSISNSYCPDNLEFLSIGNSDKNNKRGKYGEGLKMAILIFKRQEHYISINTNGKSFKPDIHNSLLGDTLKLNIDESPVTNGFVINFILPIEIYNNFKINHLIKDSDILFDDEYYGRIVNKEIGRIYCSGLFVCKVDNISNSYDINHKHLPLTRDRNLPRTFNLNWAMSKINEKHNEIKIEDLSYSDTLYVDNIPEKELNKIELNIVGNSIEPTYKNKEKTQIIKNQNVRKFILTHNLFKNIKEKLKKVIISKLGLTEMLLQFKENHIHDQKAIEDFDLILEIVKNK